ncbi:MAG: tetratricopeptide repeat protein [Sutterellaceae bacterium]|nr:tetratricopeptide repeat protein [Burkholderiaceae bacterium]MCX7902152.1 tetratricopeptide repeat protein [Burkholderiaceae bacterium]MDW8430240.1 tetratricopeptide repeat protein [Sutterellaceae bacterium]
MLLLLLLLASPVSAQTGTVARLPTATEEVERLLRAGDLAAALAHADAALAREPRNLTLRFVRAVILADQGKTAEAIAAFEELTQDFPELPEPYNNLAVLLAAQGQLEQARALLLRALQAQPNYLTAQENLGDLYVALAAEAYQRVLTMDPGNRNVQSKLALTRELSTRLRATR